MTYWVIIFIIVCSQIYACLSVRPWLP